MLQMARSRHPAVVAHDLYMKETADACRVAGTTACLLPASTPLLS